jgi:hypothetical protein
MSPGLGLSPEGIALVYVASTWGAGNSSCVTKELAVGAVLEKVSFWITDRASADMPCPSMCQDVREGRHQGRRLGRYPRSWFEEG